MLVDNKVFTLEIRKPNLYSISKIKSIPKLDIIYKNILIKQHLRDTNLTCIPNQAISWEPMAHKVIFKINASSYIGKINI